MTLYFGQQHPYNIEYFGDNWLYPKVEDFPHYKFLEGRPEEYSKYIDLSWRHYGYTPEYHEEKKAKHIGTFKALIDDIYSCKEIKTPILVTTTIDGRKIILNGNHRASIAKYFNIDLPIKEVSLIDRLRQLSINDAIRYGSGDTKVPYQPIIYRGEVLIEGRRNDSLERFAHIRGEDIQGKGIIDFGSNLGTNTLWAHENGADVAIGLEKERKLAESSIRIAVMLGYPIITKTSDLSKPVHHDMKFDTGFCFSIDRHVNNNKVLSDNISNSGINVLYFESHDLQEVPNEILNRFENCELIGRTFNNKRNFYRLTR